MEAPTAKEGVMDATSSVAMPSSRLDSSSTKSQHHYANHHIPDFIAIESSSEALSLLQVVTDGSRLTSQALLNDAPHTLSVHRPILVRDTPQSIGMKLPKMDRQNKSEISVRDVADILGFDLPVSVIDVKHQEELEGWTLGDLVDHFEDEDRLTSLRQQATQSEEAALAVQPDGNLESMSRRPRRAAAQRAASQQSKVLNQISLEFSRTPLSPLVSSPRFVRELDWIDHAWSRQRREKGDYPVVQYYCLTSTAGAYTDFHVDFGGSSVWYHVLTGEKMFVLIPPTVSNLQVYEDWLCRSNQSELFLPDLLLNRHSDVLKVRLQASQTMMIPTGWIHGVYTPKDSVVFGGNFLHGLDMQLQIDVHSLETRTHVLDRFRFPYFLPLMFYAGGMYLRRLNIGGTDNVSRRELHQLSVLVQSLEEWWKGRTDESIVPAAREAAVECGCASVEDMLWQLRL